MDYLQTVINGFKIKNPYKKDWLPFASILNKELFRTSGVNQKQINRIYSILQKYIADRKNIFRSELDKEEKYAKSHLLYTNLISSINNEVIGFSTLFLLLRSLEDEKNSQIRNILLQVLFLCSNAGFKKAIIDSASEIEQLEPGGNDVKLFQMGYRITKNKLHSEIDN